MLWLDNVLLLSLSLYPILRWWLWNKHFFFLLECSEVLPPSLILFLFKSKTLSFSLSFLLFLWMSSLTIYGNTLLLCLSLCPIMRWRKWRALAQCWEIQALPLSGGVRVFPYGLSLILSWVIQAILLSGLFPHCLFLVLSIVITFYYH